MKLPYDTHSNNPEDAIRAYQDAVQKHIDAAFNKVFLIILIPPAIIAGFILFKYFTQA